MFAAVILLVETALNNAAGFGFSDSGADAYYLFSGGLLLLAGLSRRFGPKEPA